MKNFIAFPGREQHTSVVADQENNDNYYSINNLEIERCWNERESLKLDSVGNKPFGGLPDEFTVKVRKYLPNERMEYYEQEQEFDFPANKLVGVWVRVEQVKL